MPRPSLKRRRRSLVVLGDHFEVLLAEARRRSLPLATYLRELIITNPSSPTVRNLRNVKNAG